MRKLVLFAAVMVLAAAGAAQAITIAAARALGIGQEVTIENAVIISTTDLISSGSVKNMHVQDATGGITVFGGNAEIDALLAVAGLGDQVTITGTTDSFNGLFELGEPFTIVKTGSPGIPTPAPVVLSDLADASPTAESFESELVKLSNVRFLSTGTFSGVGNFTVSATGTNTPPTAVVRISTADLDLVGAPIPTGLVNVTGVLTQFDSSDPFDSSYQLQVRSLADLEVLSPSAIEDNVITVRDAAAVRITLQGIPATPNDPLTFKIVQTADKMFPTVDHNTQGGTLTDPGTGQPVVLNQTLTGDEVDFTPAAGVNGWYQFLFAVGEQGFPDSTFGAINVFIQQPGQAIISEIMYDPSDFDIDWEYVEIRNISGSPIALDTLFDARLRQSTGAEHNLQNADDFGTPAVDSSILPAGGVKVTATNNIFRSTTQFLNEWNPGAGDVTFPAEGGDLNKIQFKNLLICNFAASSGATALPGLNNEGDLLVLFAQDGTLLDAVRYENGANGWPAANNMSSIFLESDKMTVTDNDNGANWRLSVTGVAGSQAYSAAETVGPPRDSDMGSPALLPTAPTPVVSPPTAADLIAGIINQVATPAFMTITLDATDPEMAPLTYKLVSTFEGISPTTGGGGVLKDAVTLDDVGPGSTLSTNQLLFRPDPGMTGRYAMIFQANDGTSDSNIAYVTIFIQSHNRIVVTEVMYNPFNTVSQEWEWIEVLNLNDEDIVLHSLLDENARDEAEVTEESIAGNVSGILVPANGRRVIARTPTAGGSGAWLTEWGLSGGSSVTFVPDARWPALNNNTATGESYSDRIYLYAADGTLLDVVAYDDAAPWPVDDGNASIYLLLDETHVADTFSNDNGANWALSVDGIDFAYTTPAPDSDVGSPTFLAGDLIQVFDFDNDGDVDDVDLTAFEGCDSGPEIPHGGTSICDRADFDDDNDVDSADFGAFQGCLNIEADPPLSRCMQ